MNAPIVLFTYNRPKHTEQTLTALMHNTLASESVLYIYCDGAKENACNEEKFIIDKVREVVRLKQWCKQVTIIEADKNKGLGNSIIDGVTDILKKHGKIIVLEDDIITSNGFLKYMNDALDLYQNESKVMHVSAYMYPHTEKLPETFFFNVPYPGGGWATWQRAWINFRNDADYFYNYFESTSQWDKFNSLGGKMLQKQLKENVDGRLNTWFIKWHATLIIQNGLTLYPHQSLTNNIGFDNSGDNCRTMNKFDIVNLADIIGVNRMPLIDSKKAKKIIIRFYQGKFYPIRRFLIRNTPEWIKPLLKKKLKLS